MIDWSALRTILFKARCWLGKHHFQTRHRPGELDWCAGPLECRDCKFEV
jgi:hypothetical protein